MKIVGSGDQHKRDFGYYADGSIASATNAQLVLPEHSSRSSLYFQNTSAGPMWVGFGSARATCTILNGTVNSVSITNGGFGFTRPPKVYFLGGGILPQSGIIPANSSYVGAAGPGFPSPSNPTTGRSLLTGGVVTSIAIDNPGVGYVVPPYILMTNDVLDPNGCFNPVGGGTGAGFMLQSGASIYQSMTAVTTDALAVFCTNIGATFACSWMT